MYDNIGGKIKGLAKAIFIIETIAAVISGVGIMASGYDTLILTGLLVLVVGPIVAWISSWMLYAFGQLVEDIHAMRNPQNVAEENQTHTIAFNENKKPSEHQPVQVVIESTCELCGKKSEKLQRCKINDTIGFVDLCDECAQKH